MAAAIQGKSATGGTYDGFPDGPEAYGKDGIDAALQKLFQAAVRHAEWRLEWYDRKAGEKGKVARGLRWCALILFAGARWRRFSSPCSIRSRMHSETVRRLIRSQ